MLSFDKSPYPEIKFSGASPSNLRSTFPANELSYITGQPQFIAAKKKKPKNKELEAYFEKKKEEETKLLEKYGGVDGFNNYIRQIMDDLDAELFEKFGDDNKAKCKYLMEMKSN